ncbi:glycine oxidase ThiO [Ectobacillus ponti]|uniref:glycine oxidase n=1 Tax=Ectobacillus ponti TaxID=2961894 RepID=A0AA41X3R9_9BACI|nr:glycine oxidase ThiO [Ectobacillus ponti]MCP8968132.1 glycine oxidase ThiO [Ectobacillus ponti]
MMKGYDVVIIGGGVIGCSVAYSLSGRGMRVAVVERAQIGAEASNAAAGLLGVQAEWDEHDPLFELARQSRALFPKVAVRLREQTGIDIGYEEKGIYRVAQTDGEAERLQYIMQWQRQTGEACELMDGTELREREPHLSSSIMSALFCPQDGHVLAPDLTKAFAHGAAALGAHIYEGTEVQRLIVENGRVTGVATTAGVFSCDKVVTAAGAWSTPFLQQPEWGTYPVKGEMVAVKSYRPLLAAPIFQDGFYLVPKRGGRILIGATKVEGSYQKHVEAGSVASLLERAASLLPDIRTAEWDGAWSGLRPQSRQQMPYIGPHPEMEGMYVCTGHYRNGILLAPVTGEHMADVIEGKEQVNLLQALVKGREQLASAN